MKQKDPALENLFIEYQHYIKNKYMLMAEQQGKGKEWEEVNNAVLNLGVDSKLLSQLKSKDKYKVKFWNEDSITSLRINNVDFSSHSCAVFQENNLDLLQLTKTAHPMACLAKVMAFETALVTTCLFTTLATDNPVPLLVCLAGGIPCGVGLIYADNKMHEIGLFTKTDKIDILAINDFEKSLKKELSRNIQNRNSYITEMETAFDKPGFLTEPIDSLATEKNEIEMFRYLKEITTPYGRRRPTKEDLVSIDFITKAYSGEILDNLYDEYDLLKEETKTLIKLK